MGFMPTEWNLYNQSFCGLLALCFIVQYSTRADPDPEVEKLKTKPFLAFQRLYLVIYSLAFFADWLQGPYVYALYDFYGYDTRQIAVLFIVGFMSSMVFGTIAGALADKYGRRLMCIAFSIIYIISCITKFYNNFWILFVGRVTGGLATSLIFTVFEAWMVSEHTEQGFPPELIGDTFGLAYFGNGMVAIGAGVVAEGAAGEYGYMAPFGLAIVPLALCGLLVTYGWKENYGDSKLDVFSGLGNAWQVIRSDPRVMYLGIAQSAFEGSMYTFVFMWTPAIATAETKTTLPYGTIFAVFMVCCALGSSLFSYALRKGVDILTVPKYIHAAAAIANFLVVMFVEDKTIVFFSFCLFEVACGVFFPCYGTLRSQVIPEENRAAVMNLFRIPLNAFVVVVLIKVKFMPVEMVFSITTAAHTIAFFAYSAFAARSPK